MYPDKRNIRLTFLDLPDLETDTRECIQTL